jgi:hypothetical protein
MARNLPCALLNTMRYSLPTGSSSVPSTSTNSRRVVLIILMLLITVITTLQLGIYAGIIRFHLAYVVPPFVALVATFFCALINILFHHFFERHHLRLLYLTTSLPFFLFAAAILAHFFEQAAYSILAILIATVSHIWYIVLLRMMLSISTVEE